MFSPQKYTYSSPSKPSDTSSKEANIHGKLDIGVLPPLPEPKMVENPIPDKVTQHQSISQENLIIPLADPLEDLLAASQAQIKQYKVQLPSEQSYDQPVKNSTSLIQEFMGETSEFPQKAGEDLSHKHTSQQQLSHDSKEEMADSQPPQLAPRRLSFGKLLPGPENMEELVPNKTLTDPLACHAENIMRMAMDSTMLGSFCNETISSSFSNILDESFLAKLDEKSFSDERPPKSQLAFSKAAKIDISAQDLEMAINDPLRLT